MSRSILEARRSRTSATVDAALDNSAVQAASVSWEGAFGSSFWDVVTGWSTDAVRVGGDDLLLGVFDSTLRSGNFAWQSFSSTDIMSLRAAR